MNLKRCISIVVLSILCGCATTGPAIMKFTDIGEERDNIAIVRLDQKRSFMVMACDRIYIPSSVKYLLLPPGRHEIIFSVDGFTLPNMIYHIQSKKYLELAAGKTYKLKSDTGWFFVGDDWYPELIDVTNNPKLHIANLPDMGAQVK